MTPIKPVDMKIGKFYAQYAKDNGFERLKYFKVFEVMGEVIPSPYSDDLYPAICCECMLHMGMTTNTRHGGKVRLRLMKIKNVSSQHTFSHKGEVFELTDLERLNVIAQII